MVAHFYSLGFILVIAYLIQPGSSFFSWHPFLMTLGYVGFLFQAIVVFSRESSLFGSLKHKTKVTLHWALNTFGVFSILTAFAVIYYNKEEHGRPHFKTWHGLIGVTTVCYTLIQWVAGHNLTIFNEYVKKIIPYSKLSIYHATSGTFLYVLACISLSLGIFSMWFSENTPFYMYYLSFALTALLGLIVTNQVTTKYVKPKASAVNAALSQSHKHSDKKSSKTK